MSLGYPVGELGYSPRASRGALPIYLCVRIEAEACSHGYSDIVLDLSTIEGTSTLQMAQLNQAD